MDSVVSHFGRGRTTPTHAHIGLGTPMIVKRCVSDLVSKEAKDRVRRKDK